MSPWIAFHSAGVIAKATRERRQGKERAMSGVGERRIAKALPDYALFNVDAFAWMEKRAPNSIHAIVTDPPDGLKEYSEVEKRKLRVGHGGVWRIPPSFDGCKRSPLPRFTVLDDRERA